MMGRIVKNRKIKSLMKLDLRVLKANVIRLEIENCISLIKHLRLKTVDLPHKRSFILKIKVSSIKDQIRMRF